MAYWLDSKNEEWGFIDSGEPLGLRVAEKRPTPSEIGKWADHLVELVEGKRITRVVEDRAEFEYLYRCLEKIGKPLTFSPIIPKMARNGKQLLIQAA